MSILRIGAIALLLSGVSGTAFAAGHAAAVCDGKTDDELMAQDMEFHKEIDELLDGNSELEKAVEAKAEEMGKPEGAKAMCVALHDLAAFARDQ